MSDRERFVPSRYGFAFTNSWPSVASPRPADLALNQAYDYDRSGAPPADPGGDGRLVDVPLAAEANGGWS